MTLRLSTVSDTGTQWKSEPTMAAMKFIIRLAARYSRLVILAVLVITGIAALRLPQLEVSVAAEAIVARDDPLRSVHAETERTFGSTDSVAVVVSDAELFTPEKLTAVRTMAEQLTQLPFVGGTDNLYTLRRGRLTDDELVEFSPYLDPIPATPEEAEAVRGSALKNPFVVRNLLAEDGRTMAIRIRLKADHAHNDRAIVAGIEQVIAPLRGELTRVYALGLPQIRAALSTLIVNDQVTLLPLSLAALLIALLFTLGRWEGMLLPLATAFTSVIWTLALMVVWGIPLNVITSVVPLLLVVVGSTQDIHLLSAFFAATRDGMNRTEAIDAMAAVTGLAVLLSFVTTCVGFLATALNNIQLLQEFALVASVGLLFNFVITTLLVPAVLVRGSARWQPARRRAAADRFQRFAQRLFDIVSRRRPTVLALSWVLAVAAGAGATRLQVNNNTLDFFPGDAPIIAQSQHLHRELAGTQSFDIVLASGIEGTFERVRYLQQIEQLQRYLDHTGHFDKTQSFVDIVKEINRVMAGLAPDEHALPEEDAVVREFLLFGDAAHRRPYVSGDLAQTRITVRHNITSSRQLEQAVADIHAFVAANIDPALRVSISGASILSQRAGDALAAGQAKSLLLIVVAIYVIISILFVNLKAGALALVPNILPIVILFGVMGFADIPLNTGTAMVAAIAVGICVDDTMHFLVRYNQEMAVRPSTDEAIRATLAAVARPMMSTSIALALGFGMLALSSFPPVVHFGLLGSLVILLALAANFVITPILLSYVRLVTVWDVLGVQVQSRLLEHCDLFHGMRKLQVRHLIAMSTRRAFDAGAQIVHEGDASHELFVVLDGRVRAQRQRADGTLDELNTLGVGDIFGEVALAADARRTADVVALEKTEVLVLRWRDLKGLIKYMPRTASRLILNIAASLGQRLIARKF